MIEADLMPRTAPLDEDAIAALVDTFYGRVRQDPILAPVFVRVVGTSDADWAEHLAVLRDFWSSVMLTSGYYHGNPQVVHARLFDLEPAMLDRWLVIFAETCTDLFDPEIAAAFVDKARRISRSLRRGMFGGSLQDGA